MRPCVRRFVTTFSSLLDRETSVVHSRPQGVGGFVGAQVSRVGRRSHPSRRHQRPVGIEWPRGQALPKDAGAGGGEDAGGTGDCGPARGVRWTSLTARGRSRCVVLMVKSCQLNQNKRGT